MLRPITSLFSLLFDLCIPPRNTEQVVRALSLETLLSLANTKGILPYRDKRVRALVWELKYRKSTAAANLAGHFMSEVLLGEAEEHLGTPLLIPIPMHRERRRERGYNQTELLCESALSFLGETYEYAPDVLERVISTTQQQGLPKHKRIKNVHNSMKVKDPSRVAGRVCIVVDDVSTTGATFAEAARALRVAGALVVQSLALAES